MFVAKDDEIAFKTDSSWLYWEIDKPAMVHY